MVLNKSTNNAISLDIYNYANVISAGNNDSILHLLCKYIDKPDKDKKEEIILKLVSICKDYPIQEDDGDDIQFMKLVELIIDFMGGCPTGGHNGPDDLAKEEYPHDIE